MICEEIIAQINALQLQHESILRADARYQELIVQLNTWRNDFFKADEKSKNEIKEKIKLGLREKKLLVEDITNKLSSYSIESSEMIKGLSFLKGEENAARQA